MFDSEPYSISPVKQTYEDEKLLHENDMNDRIDAVLFYVC